MNKILIVTVVAIIAVFGFDLFANRGSQIEELDTEQLAEGEEIETIGDGEDETEEEDQAHAELDTSSGVQDEESVSVPGSSGVVAVDGVGGDASSEPSVSTDQGLTGTGGPVTIDTMSPEQRAQLNDLLLEISQVLVELNATLALLSDTIEAMEVEVETV